MPRGDRGGKSSGSGTRCVAANCGNTHKDGYSLHTFPKDPSLCRQWVDFVKVKRAVWSGPTEYSAICSNHFTMDCFPFRFRFELEHLGRKPKKVQLNCNTIPSVHAAPEPLPLPLAVTPKSKNSSKEKRKASTNKSATSTSASPTVTNTTPTATKARAMPFPLEMLSPSEDAVCQSSPPKKVRRGYAKRETARLKEKLKAKYGTDACVDSPSEHEDEEESQEDDERRSPCNLEETSSTIDIPSPIVTTKTKKKYQKMQSPVENDIQEAIKQSSELQKQVQAKLASHADMTPERQNWGHWMVSILPGIDDRLWGRFKRESMDLLDRFQKESKELRSRDKQRLQQLQGFTGQQSALDVPMGSFCNQSSNVGYLPAWQQQYQLPGQDVAFLQNRSKTQADIEPIRAHSAPPVTCAQDITTSSIASVIMQSDSMNVDSPSSSLFSL